MGWSCGCCFQHVIHKAVRNLSLPVSPSVVVLNKEYYNNSFSKNQHTHSYTWRKENITNTLSRLVEVIVVSTLISIFAFFIPLAVPACHSDLNQDNETHSKFVQQFTCKEEDEYSETASMFLLPPTSTVRWIMHTNGNFDSTSLLLFFLVNTLMACIMMSGISLSGGRFVPLLASGVAFGRFFGQTVANPLNKYLLNRDRTIGLYALLGGAALVGGVERMVLSLTVILMEATCNVRFGLPLLVTLIFARWVGTSVSLSISVTHTFMYNITFRSLLLS